MTTQVIKKTETRTDVAQETSSFSVGVIMTMAGIIGIWAISCLIGGLANGGFSALIRGFVSYSRFEPIEFSISSQPTSAGLFFTRQRINLA